MMKYQSNFSKFLTNSEIYNLSKSFWKNNIESIFNYSLEEWVINHYSNNKEILDGNPIYSGKISDNVAIRIVQDERNKITPIFASWLSSVKLESGTVQELVIALQPYEYTVNDALILIEAFKNNKFIRLQNSLNRKYGRATDHNRIKYLRSNLIKTGLKNDNWNISQNKIQHNDVNLSLLKKIYHINENIQFYKLVYSDPDLIRTYSSLIIKLSEVSAVITCNDRININTLRSKHIYINQVSKHCRNMKKYYFKYNTKVDQLEHKFIEFESLVKERSE